MKRVKTLCQLILDVLRTLGDESAYQRHLAVSGRVHSRQEWQTFCDQHWRAKYVRPKCC
jgi:hypothetical protein